MPLQIRRGTDAERLAMTVPLAQGELLYITNQQKIYVGDGATLAGALAPVTGYTNTDAKDAAASIFTGGSHSGIGFTYNTATDIITATVDLSNYTGTIKASSFKGTIVADDSTLLVDAVDGKINLDGTVRGHIVPANTGLYDIGTNSTRFKDLYLSGSTIRLSTATITAVGSAINLPLGSTVNGVVITAGDGVVAGSNYNINITRDDSTLMVNTSNGQFTGNLTGNVTGNTAGFHTGGVIGVVTGTAGSSLVGNVLGSTTGFHTGDVKGSVFGDDSTRIIDSTAGRIVGVVDNQLVETQSIVINKALVGNSYFPPAAGGISIFANTSLDDDVSLFSITTAHSDAFSSGMIFNRSRGSVETPSVLLSNDGIFSFLFTGYANSQFLVAANIEAGIDGSVGTFAPGRLSFQTSDNLGNLTSRLDINSKGTSAFSGMVQLPTFADETAANAAVTIPVNGMMYYDSGAGKVKARQGGAWVALT
jgi:hypothetical protein